MMFQAIQIVNIICALLLFLSQNVSGASQQPFLHLRPEQHKNFPGWQEPGLWRPKWIMDREFVSAKTGKVVRDRLFFKLKPDRTVQLFATHKRPWVQMFKRRQSSKPSSLSDNEVAVQLDSVEDVKIFKSQLSELQSIDGTWSLEHKSNENSAHVVFELQEEPIHGGHKNILAVPLRKLQKIFYLGRDKKGDTVDQETQRQRVRHEVSCTWGAMDGYAAKFQRGTVYRYHGQHISNDRAQPNLSTSRAQKSASKFPLSFLFSGLGINKHVSVPLGKYPVGQFYMRANAQRPLVTKDYIAFQ
jgi:hypothetical protein